MGGASFVSIKITFRSNLPPVLQTQPMTSEPELPDYAGSSNKMTEEIITELDSLIGLESVKKLIHELYAFVEICKRREKEKLNTEPLVLHTVFSGNPGTGKTTVARLIGRLFKEMGVLPKGHIIECERADLVGEYVGHTANKTRELVKKALGGILFIDEAYSLARGGEKDFGKEAIDALVKAMEDHKDNLILILAGYKVEMDAFIKTNPGLRSRFPLHIDFPDYSLDELMSIGEQMLTDRQYTFSPQAKIVFRRNLQDMNDMQPYSGNARMVRNFVEKAIRKQAVRLYRQANLSREDLMCIKEVDIS
ncbi:Stage V sporulation protein [Dehalobacter sp. UNSWDHB]|jgi:ATPases of the AAA+ class|nr:Stage V sporulation protein [Dehalobacter sp. UNSWDHB]